MVRAVGAVPDGLGFDSLLGYSLRDLVTLGSHLLLSQHTCSDFHMMLYFIEYGPSVLNWLYTGPG